MRVRLLRQCTAAALVVASLLVCVPSFAQTDALEEVRGLIKSQRYADAREVIDAHLQRQPNDYRALFLNGVVLAELGDVERAVEVFSRLTRSHPELPEPYNNLAVLYAQQGDFDRARDALLLSINTHPSYSTAHENLGDIYAKMAGVAYDRALQLDVANSRAGRKLALVEDLFSVSSIALAQSNVAPSTVDGAKTAQGTRGRGQARPRERVDATRLTAQAKQVVERSETERVAAKLSDTTRVERPTVAAPSAVEARSKPEFDEQATRKAVLAALTSWAAAWSSKDVDGYLSHYHAAFKPAKGKSRRAWMQLRRQRLSKPKRIDVRFDKPEFKRLDESVAQVVIVQYYQSDTYGDVVRKQMTLVKTPGGWKITSERDLS